MFISISGLSTFIFFTFVLVLCGTTVLIHVPYKAGKMSIDKNFLTASIKIKFKLVNSGGPILIWY